MIKIFTFCAYLLAMPAAFGQKKPVKPAKKWIIQFTNEANGKKIVLNDSTYTNAFGEKYSISKLKYYISDIHYTTAGPGEPNGFDDNTYLIDASKENIIKEKAPIGKLTGVTFILGVDSVKNCSGAQSGALDPLNDMFWTWNSGYVMFKLEGRSDSSKADSQRIEQHIGGYKGNYSAVRLICVTVKNPGRINIIVNLDKYWNGKNKIRIAKTAVTTTVGADAKKAADNFPGMFSAKD